MNTLIVITPAEVSLHEIEFLLREQFDLEKLFISEEFLNINRDKKKYVNINLDNTIADEYELIDIDKIKKEYQEKFNFFVFEFNDKKLCNDILTSIVKVYDVLIDFDNGKIIKGEKFTQLEDY